MPVVVDAAQAHGVRRGSNSNGGDAFAGALAACFSFYPAKNLGAAGEAGACVTNDGELAHTLRSVRDHGRVDKHTHRYRGSNMRMDEIQAAVLGAKLPLLDAWNRNRQRAANRYLEGIQSYDDLRLPTPAPEGHHVWHLFTVETPHRDGLRAHLDKRGIKTGLHYPTPLHLHPALESLGHGRGDFPCAERIADQTVSLPMFAGITDAQVDAVIAAVNNWSAAQ